MFTRIWNLTRLGMALSLGPVTFVAAPTPIQAQQPSDPADLDETYRGESPERYAQVKAVEGDVRIRKGEVEEALERGMPVAEGDVIDSRGRGVLQLGDGTRLAFAAGTRFQVAALFTDKGGERQVLLRLDQGRLRIALGGQSQARLRVDTQAGTATMLDRGNATLQLEGDGRVRVKVHAGHLSFSTDQDRVRINAGERLTVYSRADRLDRVSAFNTYERDGFDAYCERALDIRRGESWDRVPAEIRYYSDDLDGNGEWVDVPEVGWCWRPTAVVGDWRPYWRGRWGAYAGGMTWISDDPWGYVTFHFGRWGWNAGWGWYWIPGRHYSPAWVAWNWNSGYYGWAPLGYWNHPVHWGYGAWGGGYCWNVVHVHHINAHRLHHHALADRRVFDGFSGGTGATTWSGGRNGRFRTAPLLVSQAEFRSPDRIAHAFDRRVADERMRAYERSAAATGRTVIRREPVAPDSRRADRVPFEDRIRTTDLTRDRRGTDAPGPRENRTRDSFREERRSDPKPADRIPHERRIEPAPRETPGDRRSDRSFDPPPPRERVREERTMPSREERTMPSREERRMPSREERTMPSREERSAPAREERRPEPMRDRPRESFREERGAPPSRSAPAPSAPSRSSPPPAPPPSRSAPPPSGGGGPRR